MAIGRGAFCTAAASLPRRECAKAAADLPAASAAGWLARALLRRPRVFLLDERWQSRRPARGGAAAQCARPLGRWGPAWSYVTNDQSSKLGLADRIRVLRMPGRLWQRARTARGEALPPISATCLWPVLGWPRSLAPRTDGALALACGLSEHSWRLLCDYPEKP